MSGQFHRGQLIVSKIYVDLMCRKGSVIDNQKDFTYSCYESLVYLVGKINLTRD